MPLVGVSQARPHQPDKLQRLSKAGVKLFTVLVRWKFSMLPVRLLLLLRCNCYCCLVHGTSACVVQAASAGALRQDLLQVL